MQVEETSRKDIVLLLVLLALLGGSPLSRRSLCINFGQDGKLPSGVAPGLTCNMLGS